MNQKNRNQLFKRLNSFIKKYYQNQLIKGGIYAVSILVIFFLIFTIIEHFFSFNVIGRTILFWSYLGLNTLILTQLILVPLLHLFKLGDTLTHKEAAKIIGSHFAEVDDKLLNLIELREVSEKDNALIEASIIQKEKSLSQVRFNNAIDFSLNKQHLKWLFTPLAIVLLFILCGKEYMLTESSARIIRHNTFFEPKAPFKYVLLNDSLICKQYDQFLLKVKVTGNQIPNEIFIFSKNTKLKLKSLGENKFSYLFSRVHSDIDFKFLAGGYTSKNYKIRSLSQPKVVAVKTVIFHPKYTKKNIETVKNNGDLVISEGSILKWDVQLQNSDSCWFKIENRTIQKSNKNSISIQKQIFKNSKYSIISKNKNGLRDTLNHYIKVIFDEFPKIRLTQAYDTINRSYFFNGIAEDDYEVKKLEFVSSYTKNDSLITSITEIPVEKNNLIQFFYEINFDLLNVESGKELSYYFKVWDNDEINGSKFSKSKIFKYKESSNDERIEKKDAENKKTKLAINSSISLINEIQKEITSLNKKILEKKKITWEEKQRLTNILKKQKKLENQISNTQKKNSDNLTHQEKLNSSTLEKQRKLEKLMSDVLDPELKKLLEEITKELNNNDKQKLKELLEKLDKENSGLEKELERDLELFKQLEFEQKLEEVLDKISDLTLQQKTLKKETEERNSKKEELVIKQEDLDKKMDDIKKDLKGLREKNMALENKNNFPKTQKTEDAIKENMKDSQHALKNKQMKKALKSQQNAIDEINKLKAGLESLQESSEQDKPIENMETLRKILENLIILSFDQEKLITAVNNTPRNSAEFVTLVRKQNRLSENSKIIEDSLFALSKRVVEIEGSINRDISKINSNMKKSTSDLESRNINSATKRQQFVMTSSNNLALLLSEMLEQMQKELDMPSSQCNKPKNCNKPNPNCKKPSFSELKKAQKKLNEKMKKNNKGEGKNGEKHGEKKSKELINLARQQEEIREQLMELRNEIGKEGSKGKIDKLIEEMKETERDIINNNITKETINRQKEILTRLLDSENAKREKDTENKRISNEWIFNLENKTEEFLEYEKQKKTQEELLKTTPIELSPFYKKKVTLYFNAIIND